MLRECCLAANQLLYRFTEEIAQSMYAVKSDVNSSCAVPDLCGVDIQCVGDFTSSSILNGERIYGVGVKTYCTDEAKLGQCAMDG
jgi:hypothetical protein